MPREQNKEITKAALAREVETIDILLNAKVGRTAITLDEYIQLRLVQGATLDTIKKALLVDLKTGGRIFGEFTNAMKPTFAGSTNRFHDVGLLSETDIDDKLKWVAVLVNTCPDCVARHKTWPARTWDEWEKVGLPKTGATVCKEHCKCFLAPVEVLEPIKRTKRNG